VLTEVSCVGGPVCARINLRPSSLKLGHYNGLERGKGDGSETVF
jgi:hypothetical protein